MLLEPVIGYTRVVFATKFLLLFIAVALLFALIIVPLTSKVNSNYRLTFSAVDDTHESKGARMINPRFQGVDGDDQAYNITANSATKFKDNSLILDNINADINMNDGSWIALISNTGKLRYDEKLLDLLDTVSLFTNQGYEFHTSEIHVNLQNKSAFGTKAVQGQGPIGTLVADRFSVFNKGDKILFQGNVKIVLYPKAQRVYSSDW